MNTIICDSSLASTLPSTQDPSFVCDAEHVLNATQGNVAMGLDIEGEMDEVAHKASYMMAQFGRDGGLNARRTLVRTWRESWIPTPRKSSVISGRCSRPTKRIFPR